MRDVIRDVTCGRVNLAYEDVREFDYSLCRDNSGQGISRDEWRVVHEAFSQPERVMSIEPLSGAKDGLAELSRLYQVHLVTSRLPAAHQATRDWLARHDIRHHKLDFVPSGRKHQDNSGLVAAIEDHYAQAVEFARIGVPCYLISHPWNMGKAKMENVFWVEDWQDLVSKLMANG